MSMFTLRRAKGTFFIRVHDTKDNNTVELYKHGTGLSGPPLDVAHRVHQGPFGLEVVWQKSANYETLMYNPVGRCYWGFDTLNGLNGQEYETGDVRLCYCPRYKYINWMIPKNSITCQLATIIKNNLGYGSAEPWFDDNINKYITYYTKPYGPAHNKSYMANYENYKGYKRFIIYRDPVDRFITLANYTYRRNYWLGRNYRTRRPLSPEEHVTEMILFARIVNGSTPIRWHAKTGEEHTFGQWRVLQHLSPSDVDYFIHIDDTNTFMKEVLHVEPLPANVSSTHHVTARTLTAGQRHEIADIYKDDYRLIGRFRDKMWGRLKDSVLI
mgnify:CR=1 FL=1